ncbi:hypothetical protein PENTCL1PPCAC_23864, partial [Pristionchus entomophagus]
LSLSLLLLLSSLALSTEAGPRDVQERRRWYGTCPKECASEVTVKLLKGSYPTMLIMVLVIGLISNILLLVLNIFIMRFIKNKLVVETEMAMQKCFEVIDNVLVEMMPRKIQTQLQAAIGGSNKTKGEESKESENKEGTGEQSAASAVSQVSAQK